MSAIFVQCADHLLVHAAQVGVGELPGRRRR